MGRLDLARWVKLDTFVDSRGILTAIEAEQAIPFPVRRVYYMHHVTAERAGHAHRDTQQLLIPVAGSCEVELSDGHETRKFCCDDPSRGLYIVPMLFIRLPKFSEGAVILVLASTHYDKSRSIRSWEEYLEEVRCQRPPLSNAKEI